MRSPETDLLPAGTPIDLSNCEREPIHVPGSIQPRGVLLAVTEPDLVVEQVSENLADLVGVHPADALGRRLHDVLGVAAAVTAGVDGVPVRATAAYVSAGEPGVLVDLPVDDRAGWELRAAAHAAATVETEGDIHASAAYRSRLVHVLTARALTEAAGTAGRARLQAAG